MPNFIDRLGLDFLTETEEDAQGLLAMIASEGKAITGYYGLPYINHELGWAQFIENTSRMENGNIQFESLHTHCVGVCEWDVCIVDVIRVDADTDLLSKQLLVKTPEGRGAAVIHVVNSDVLPSYRKDEIIHLQVAAFAKHIEYFEDYEAYEKSVEPSFNEKKVLAAQNTLLPIGLFGDEEHAHCRDQAQICGFVKKMYHGKVEIGEDIFCPFLGCIVDTQFGEIEIIHTIDDVAESQRANLRVGALVNCVAVLSGDAAIGIYDNGVVRDAENNLRLMAYIFSGGDPERMRSAVSADFEYYSESSGKRFESIDDFITFVKHVQEVAKPCHTHYATISEIKDGGDALEFSVGTRCFALTYGDSTEYEAITFVATDNEGYISRIYLSTDSRYRFRVDSPMSEPDESDFPEKVCDYEAAMMARAHFHGVFSYKIQKEDIQALFGRCGARWIGAALERIPAEASEEAFAEAFMTGVKHSKATEYNEAELRRISAQFSKDYNPCLISSDDPEGEVKYAQIFTMFMGYMYGECQD